MMRKIGQHVGWVEPKRNPALKPPLLGFIAFNPAYLTVAILSRFQLHIYALA